MTPPRHSNTTGVGSSSSDSGRSVFSGNYHTLADRIGIVGRSNTITTTTPPPPCCSRSITDNNVITPPKSMLLVVEV